MCTFAEMKTILVFILCEIVIRFSEAYVNNVNLPEEGSTEGDDMVQKFIHPTMLFGVEVNNEHICNGIVYNINTGISTAKCALKIRSAEYGLHNLEDMKIWYGQDLGQHTSWTLLYCVRKYNIGYNKIVVEIPDFYDPYLQVDIGLISLRVPFQSDKVQEAPISNCIELKTVHEFIVMSRDSSANAGCASSFLEVGSSSSSGASSVTMPAEYLKPIRTLAVLKLKWNDCKKAYKNRHFDTKYMFEFECIQPKNEGASFETTDIGSPVIYNGEKGVYVIGIICHIGGDGLPTLFASFEEKCFTDECHDMRRPRPD